MTESFAAREGVGTGHRWDFAMAFLVLRGWLGLRALLAGIQKFGAYHSVAMPLIDPATGQADASGVMTNVNVKSYACANYADVPKGLMDKFAHEPLLAKVMLTAFDGGACPDRPARRRGIPGNSHRVVGRCGLCWLDTTVCGAKQSDPRLVSRVVVLSKAL